jgi:CRP-like cAMP-binding protein
MSLTQDSLQKDKRNAVILERRFIQEGSIIMKEGEIGKNAFLIQSGEVDVYTERDGKRIDLARMGAGQIIGEMALVVDGPRTATVEAIKDCNLIVINGATLQQKLEDSDPTIRSIVPMLMKRVRNTSDALSNKSSNPDDIAYTIDRVYNNVLSSMPEARAADFEKLIVPKIEEFLEAIRDFKNKFGD